AIRILIRSTDSCQALFCLLAAPLAHTSIWNRIRILYPCLRVVDLLQVQGESVRSLPPRRVIPFCMKALNLEVESHFCPNVAAKGKSLAKFASQLTIDSL